MRGNAREARATSGAQRERTLLSDELWSNERSATARERARALLVVAVIFGSAALVAGLALRTTEGAAVGVVLLALTAFGGAVAWKFERI